MRGRVSVMLVMEMITVVMIYIAEVAKVPIEARTVSVCIHVRIVGTAYTVIHLRSITASGTSVIASDIWHYMGMVIYTTISSKAIITCTVTPIIHMGMSTTRIAVTGERAITVSITGMMTFTTEICSSDCRCLRAVVSIVSLVTFTVSIMSVGIEATACAV